jgi:hypothetical protein
MRQPLGMCIVNRELVSDLAPLVGTRDQVMQRLGISWNSWVKIVAGQPIRTSVGLRLKERALAHSALTEAFRRKFPCPLRPDGIDRGKLEGAFLSPAIDPAARAQPRSV